MRLTHLLLSSVLSLALLAPSSPAAPVVVGHRGTGVNRAGNPFPENTLPSIREAFREGAALVEVDVQLDAEGRAILWHDGDLRVVDMPGKRTADLRLEEFPLLPSPNGPVEVPTFRDSLRLALELAPGKKVMDIEIKLTRGEFRRELVTEIARIVREEGAQDRVVMSSFDLEAVRLVEELLPGVESGYLVSDPAGGWAELELLLADPAEPRIEWLLTSRRYAGGPYTPEQLVAACAAEGVRLGVWTVNRRFELFRFWKAGFDMLITDEPPVALELLD